MDKEVEKIDDHGCLETQELVDPKSDIEKSKTSG